jgi:hypothetical protein
MVTPRDIMAFALDCKRWSHEVENASDREIIMQVSKMWSDTAAFLEHRIELGDELAMPDLRTKLN